MSDDVQKFLEAVHGRLQALSLAGVTLVPRLLPKSLPSTAASSSENAATTGAKPAAPSATPGNGHSWKDVIGHMKAELSKAGAKASAAQPATAKPGATRPAALPTVPPPRTRAAAPAPAASAAQATPPAPATQPSGARATPSAGESGEEGIRSGADALGKAGGDAAVAASKIVAEVKGQLTAEQIEMIRRHRAARGSEAAQRLDETTDQ